MNIKSLSNDNLLEVTKSKALKERQLTLDVIECLQEIYSRRLHLELGYNSLHTYCVKELGYSDSEAYSRINAMKLVNTLPETKASILEGKLSLTTAAQAQSFFNRQKRQSRELKPEVQKNVINTLSGLSKREVEKELISLGLELGDTQMDLKEKVRVVAPLITEIKVFVPDELMSKLNKIKNLISHKYPNATYLELLEELAKIAIEKLDLERAQIKSPKLCPPPQQQHNSTLPEKLSPKDTKDAWSKKEVARTPKPSRYIPKHIKQFVWRQAEGKCQYRDHKTKRVCNSTYKLQFEHKVPWAVGGAHTKENLTLLCASHNLLTARHFYQLTHNSVPRTNSKFANASI